MDTVNVIKILSNAIDRYRQQDEKHSYKHIENLCDIASKYIERAHKEEITNLNEFKFMEVAKVVCTEEEKEKMADAFAKRLYDNSCDYLKDAIYDRFVIEFDKKATRKLESALKDEKLSVGYAIAASMNGAKESLLQTVFENVFGGLGKSVMGQLLEMELISRTDDKITVIQERFSSTLEGARRRAEIFLRHYKTQNAGKKSNFVFVVTEGVSRKGLELIQAKFSKLYEECHRIAQENPGNIPSFFAGFMDTFLSDLEESLDQIENKLREETA